MKTTQEKKEYDRKNYLKKKEKLKEQSRIWKENNPDKRKEYNKLYVEKNRDKVRESSDKWKAVNWEQAMFCAARSNAKKMGREFSITIEDIIIPTHCPYLRVLLTRELRREDRMYNPSIDRIDSSKGYIKGNIRIISNKANRMKSNLTEEELLTIATCILKLHGGNNE